MLLFIDLPVNPQRLGVKVIFTHSVCVSGGGGSLGDPALLVAAELPRLPPLPCRSLSLEAD